MHVIVARYVEVPLAMQLLDELASGVGYLREDRVSTSRGISRLHLARNRIVQTTSHCRPSVYAWRPWGSGYRT